MYLESSKNTYSRLETNGSPVVALIRSMRGDSAFDAEKCRHMSNGSHNPFSGSCRREEPVFETDAQADLSSLKYVRAKDRTLDPVY